MLRLPKTASSSVLMIPNPYQSPRELNAIDADPPLAGDRVAWHGTMSRGDVAQAIKLAKTGTSSLMLRGLTSFLLLPIVVVVWVVLLFAFQARLGLFEIALVLSVVLVVPVVLIVGQLSSPWLIASQLAMKGGSAESEGEVNRTHFVIREGGVTTAFEWHVLQGYRSNADVLVAYTAYPTNFIFLVRTAFQSQSDWERAIDIVASKLPRR